MTATTRWSWPRAWSGAMSRCIRTLSRFLRQVRVPYLAGLHVGDAAQAFAPSRRRS